jgi:predicted MFS family arabinose efflux permease
MTAAELTGDERAGGRPPLVTRALLLRFVSIFGASVSFYLPLSVMPLYLKSSGYGSDPGLATAALLLATVVAELATPRLMSRVGDRLALATGLVLLGAPALALLRPASLAVVLAVSVARGVGLAIAAVAGGALTASLIPVQRRGEGLGLVGIVSGVPGLVGLPAGVWIAGHWGYGPVFAATAAAALLAVGSVAGLPGRRHGESHAPSVLAGLRNPSLVRLGLVFGASTVAAGVLVTIVPLAVGSTALAAAALFAQTMASTASRWAAGPIGDRRGQGGLLGLGVLLAAAGMACLAAVHTAALVLSGAACFGVGFGLLQNATLALMYAHSTPSGYSVISAIWNAAYDAGMGVGAAGIGLLVACAGYPGAFLVTAALLLPALVPALGERKRRRQLLPQLVC